MKKKIRGFTLLELLVVLAVLGVFSVIAYPNISNWITDREVRSEAYEFVAEINQIKSKPCDMCGGIFPPSAMDFHHIDPETKTNKGGRGIERSWSIEKIDAEIEKCILVCANCHRIIHASVEEVLEFEIWQTTETQRDSSGVRRI